MALRKLLPARALPLVGGAVCLDFVNTTGARASGSPRERLRTYEDLLTWSRRAGILNRKTETMLRKLAKHHEARVHRALRRVRRVREDLYALFRAVAQGNRPSPILLKRLTAEWRAERRQRELVIADKRFKLEPRGTNEPDLMVGPLVASAVELLVSERLERVKRCGECDWLFVDETKNGSRRWCKKVCGDRVRARRYYAQTRLRSEADR